MPVRVLKLGGFTSLANDISDGPTWDPEFKNTNRILAQTAKSLLTALCFSLLASAERNMKCGGLGERMHHAQFRFAIAASLQLDGNRAAGRTGSRLKPI